MSDKTIHFAHANGFPAGTYLKLFSFLKPSFNIRYIERHGHESEYPVTDGWKRLKDELRDAIIKDFTRPVTGVGHSLGGILHLLVSVENPELYERVILLDAPIISRLSSGGIRVLKTLRLMDRFSPSSMTKTRRNFWKTKEAALEHFRAKAKFAAFDADVLRDYIEYGTTQTPEGFCLSFDPHIEAAIYRTIPHTLPLLKGKLTVPTSYIGGTNSREAKLAGLGFMQSKFPIQFRFIEGSHLFPFENPKECAEEIISLAQST